MKVGERLVDRLGRTFELVQASVPIGDDVLARVFKALSVATPIMVDDSVNFPVVLDEVALLEGQVAHFGNLQFIWKS